MSVKIQWSGNEDKDKEPSTDKYVIAEERAKHLFFEAGIVKLREEISHVKNGKGKLKLQEDLEHLIKDLEQEKKNAVTIVHTAYNSTTSTIVNNNETTEAINPVTGEAELKYNYGTVSDIINERHIVDVLNLRDQDDNLINFKEAGIACLFRWDKEIAGHIRSQGRITEEDEKK